MFKEGSSKWHEARIPHSKDVHKNVDFLGYFQYHTKFYAPHKEFFRSLFKPVSKIDEKLQIVLQRLYSKGKTLIGLHLRRGDYGYGPFFVAPSVWYKEWLDGFWETLDDPVLFIASDEPEEVIGDFEEYKPITSNDLD